MNRLTTWCFVTIFIQAALGKAQSDDQTPPVLQSSTQLVPESLQQSQGEVQDAGAAVSPTGVGEVPIQQAPSYQESIQTPASSAATFPIPSATAAPSQPTTSYPTSIQSPVSTAQSSLPTPGVTGYSSQPTTTYPTSIQSPVPSAGTFPTPSASGIPSQPITSYPTSIQSPVTTVVSPYSTPAMSGYLPQQAGYPTSIQSPFQTGMSAYSSQNPNDLAAYAAQGSYYPRSPGYPPMAYGNAPYFPGPYYPMQYPMGYMNPMMPYMGANPAAYAPFLQPRATNYNRTQLNGSSMTNAQPFTPYPQTAYAPAPESPPDQTAPTVVSSTGESGSDLNSLPPQVKEFIDMIPNILSMQDTPQPTSRPTHPIKHAPLRKYPKSATPSLFKKKQYYSSYPQYPDYPRRYGYYY